MGELRDLYQEVLLDHGRRPRNRRRLENANRSAEGFNPLCGDRVTIYLRLANGVVEEVTFEGSGCAISTASASMITEILKGKTEAEARELARRFVAMVTAPADREVDADDLGKLVVFAGVREFPVRVKCATLIWHTMEAALENKSETVSTE